MTSLPERVHRPARSPGTVGLLAAMLLLLLPCGALAQVAGAPEPAFDIAIIGDMPYTPNPDTATRSAVVMREYHAVLGQIAASPAGLVVHVGDVTGFHCADSVLALRRRDFDAMPQAVVLTPGDNEWVDCGRAGFDPLERLDRVRTLFAEGDSSMGRQRIRLERQGGSGRFPEMRENVRWQHGGVLFVTLHVVPLPGDYLELAGQAREHVRRDSANIAWVHDAFDVVAAGRLRGIAVFLQANPGWGTELRPEFVGVRDALVARSASFRGEVAVVHGDSHLCRVDRPAADLDGQPLLHLIRAETFGNPRHHWLRMRVTPGGDTLFHFTPEFVEGNAPGTCQVHGRLVTPGRTAVPAPR